jgi:XRE family transcriptional regulator, regulator of sulfur utilization
MDEQSKRPGRPKGATTTDPFLAQAFGAAVRESRLRAGLAQEDLAHLAGIERSHVGKIERGEHAPTLVVAFKLARALGVGPGELVAEADTLLQQWRE